MVRVYATVVVVMVRVETGSYHGWPVDCCVAEAGFKPAAVFPTSAS